MILVDSSVWIDYFRGVTNPATGRLDQPLGEEPLAIGDLILTEVLQGISAEEEFDTAKRLLKSLTMIKLGGREVAIQAARNFRTLTIDAIIATRCIMSGYTLLHPGSCCCLRWRALLARRARTAGTCLPMP